MFAANHVTPAVVAFLQRFPDLEIELVLADAIVDLIEERLDVAIRIGNLGASSLKVRRLANLRRVIVASPIYLARHGEPHMPSDLSRHACVVRTFGPEGDSWPLTIGEKPTAVAVRGTLRCNDAASANTAVVSGAGLGLAPLWQVRADLDQGRLAVVLAEFEPPPIPVQAVWPGNAGTPARTRLFVDTIAARLAAERL
ncbi:MAG: substrate binding domain-containing protein [Azospirillaceae bacterium]|nr:substrate binding domain-containing protein [Azospirillaceae bacterium]